MFTLQQHILYGGTVGAVLGWGAGSVVAWFAGRLTRPLESDPPACRSAPERSPPTVVQPSPADSVVPPERYFRDQIT